MVGVFKKVGVYGVFLWGWLYPCVAIDFTAFESPSDSEMPGFYRVPPEESGLTAISHYEDPRAWRERLEPATIGTVGSGIGAGDFNQDGWPDLFIGMREGKNRLYLNDQNGGFVDRTEEAGILESEDWTTGVTVVDINGDGFLDIYVCFFEAFNRLYLNRGDGTFEESAIELGLVVSDAVSGAYFADHDKDGDLDLYLQTNTGNDGAGRPDYFFRNDGDLGFLDVSSEVGILQGAEGTTLGHSVLWIDWDDDGWEDLYVANDFRAPDFLYLNNGDGTFQLASEKVPIAPYSSMGSDIGDVNNDGRLDILTTDMATPSYLKHVQSMLTSGTKTRDIPEGSWPRQVMKNVLLLNRGYEDYVDVVYAWNLAATDWTWAPRLVDLDNDGWMDVCFTNGMIRQFHNADLALAQDRQTTIEAKTAVFQRSPVLNERNLVFRNLSGRGYEEANALWGFEDEGVSFATALLDYDRDGDLDMVYTNYQAAPTIWRNDLGDGNAVQVKLVGAGMNRQAIGALAIAEIGENKVAQKLLSNRGYLGTDEQLLHFGMGTEERIRKLDIIWPDGSKQTVENLEKGSRYTIEYEDGVPKGEPGKPHSRFVFKSMDNRADENSSRAPTGEGAYYPFKPLPGSANPKLLREDFNRDTTSDSLILREWEAPRLIVSGETMADASSAWGLEELKGLWDVVQVEDFNQDGYPDVFLGGLGINNDVSYRGAEDGVFQRFLGRYSERGPLVNLNAYDWNGTMRLYDSLREFTDVAPAVFRRISSFGATANMTPQAFIDRVGFKVEKEFQIDHFRSGLLINQTGQSFEFFPLPLEAQYGRVWALVSADLNEDGFLDLILLMGQVSPHYLSSQNEGSFIYVLLNKENNSYVSDDRPPLNVLPKHRIIDLSVNASNMLELHLENSDLMLFTVNN